jgi:hypothetical protein
LRDVILDSTPDAVHVPCKLHGQPDTLKRERIPRCIVAFEPSNSVSARSWASGRILHAPKVELNRVLKNNILVNYGK